MPPRNNLLFYGAFTVVVAVGTPLVYLLGQAFGWWGQ